MKTIALVFGKVSTERYGVHQGYVDSLIAVGAVSLPVCSMTALTYMQLGDLDLIDQYSSEVSKNHDALLLSGGADVNPARYNEETSNKTTGIEDSRDLLEISMIRAFMNEGKKILAVCRGVQILNVALGGTLIQDLKTEGYQEHMVVEQEYGFAHEIEFEPNSKCSAISQGATSVNSLHHQAIKQIAPSLKATAYSPDGVVEAVESDQILGVQWHPERMISADKRQLSYFSWLVE